MQHEDKRPGLNRRSFLKRASAITLGSIAARGVYEVLDQAAGTSAGGGGGNSQVPGAISDRSAGSHRQQRRHGGHSAAAQRRVHGQAEEQRLDSCRVEERQDAGGERAGEGGGALSVDRRRPDHRRRVGAPVLPHLRAYADELLPAGYSRYQPEAVRGTGRHPISQRSCHRGAGRQSRDVQVPQRLRVNRERGGKRLIRRSEQRRVHRRPVRPDQQTHRLRSAVGSAAPASPRRSPLRRASRERTRFRTTPN